MAETIIQKARGHLGSAIIQSIPSDDQIIMDHVKAAYALLEFTPDIKQETAFAKAIAIATERINKAEAENERLKLSTRGW